MATRPESLIPSRRSIIDRRALADGLEACLAPVSDGEARRAILFETLHDALEEGRAELARRLHAAPAKGLELAAARAFLFDQLLRLAFEGVTTHLYPAPNRTTAERIALIAVGGYGRGQLAPFSDLDILFLTPLKRTAWAEQVIESLLYLFWDLGLKVGHAARSVDELLRFVATDMETRTALLEARFICGDQPLAEAALARFRAEVVAGSGRAFLAAKLAERDARHQRMGDSRYLVEPNLKEGKGGLRDLHTLMWIGRHLFGAESVHDLVGHGLLSPAEARRFRRAESFLWAVRNNLHDIAGRAEERLTFDTQPEIARRLAYANRDSTTAVERFMRHWFLVVRTVGDLTGLFLAQVEERNARLAWLPALTRRPARLNGFILRRGRLGAPDDDFFRAEPVRLIELFAIAARERLPIHPQTLRQAARDAVLIDDEVRRDRAANALFLEVLTDPHDPETVLRAMNDTGVFGRFIPDFGRVVALMQFDMYHHYTVDEHSIRAIGLIARIADGTLRAEHKLSHALLQQLSSRRVLHVAVLLHDIAKGRGGDHSEIGAEIALRLCPRLGLTPAETETVAWLVRHHLLMSRTAFKRDLSDYKTILDFAEAVASPERLRLLLLLTVVDIRAVGPGVWNAWKGQLLRELYEAAEELLRRGHKQKGREQRIAERRAALGAAMGWDESRLATHAARFIDSYWVAEPPDVLAANARLIEDAQTRGLPLAIACQPDEASGTTLVTVHAADHPGLFYRIAGAISLAGANILDARIHTTRDGRAVDNFTIADPLGRPFAEPAQLERLRRTITDVLTGRIRLADRLAARPLARRRAEVFRVQPYVLFDNRASNRFTVAEVGAADRPALLYALTRALFDGKVTIHSAHIATWGERATDTFYLTDLTGAKITDPARLAALEARLLAAARAPARRSPAPPERAAAE